MLISAAQARTIVDRVRDKAHLLDQIFDIIRTEAHNGNANTEVTVINTESLPWIKDQLIQVGYKVTTLINNKLEIEW